MGGDSPDSDRVGADAHMGQNGFTLYLLVILDCDKKIREPMGLFGMYN